MNAELTTVEQGEAKLNIDFQLGVEKKKARLVILQMISSGKLGTPDISALARALADLSAS